MNSIISEVEIVRKYIKKPEIKKLYQNNFSQYETHLKEKFSNFSEKKPFLFDMAISQDKFDFGKLKEFCSIIDKVNNGKMTSENASKYVGQKYYDQYVKNKVENKVEEVEDEVQNQENKVEEEITENKIESEKLKKSKKLDLEYV